MMTNEQLWAENGVLRQRLHEVQAKLAAEHELRLKLEAENLWIKRLLRKDLREGMGLAVSTSGGSISISDSADVERPERSLGRIRFSQQGVGGDETLNETYPAPNSRVSLTRL